MANAPINFWGRRCLPLSPTFSTQPNGASQGESYARVSVVSTSAKPLVTFRRCRYGASDEESLRKIFEKIGPSVTQCRRAYPSFEVGIVVQPADTLRAMLDATIDHVSIAVRDLQVAIP